MPYQLIIAIIIITMIYIAYIFNQFIQLKKCIERSKATIDVFLKKRFDLIPNLVETVKGYADYESNTLQKIIELRNDYNMNLDEKSAQELNKQYHKIIALIENYPELKTSESFLALQKSLVKIESELQAARRLYTNDVTNYNTKIQKIPANLFAKLFGFKLVDYLQFDIDNIEIKL